MLMRSEAYFTGACPVKFMLMRSEAYFTGVLFVAKLFSSRHQGTKTLRKNNKIKSFVSLCLGGKYFWFSPSRSLYPPACKPYGLEAEPEAGLFGLGMNK